MACRSENRPKRFGCRPRNRLSATVIDGTSVKCWWTMPIPARLAAIGSGISIPAPVSRIVPALGWWMPARMFISVDLPAPFSPQMTCTSPGRTSRSTCASATFPPKDLAMPRRLRSGSGPLMGSPGSCGRRASAAGARTVPISLERGVDLEAAAHHLGLGLVDLRLDLGGNQLVIVDQADPLVGQAVDLERAELGLPALDLLDRIIDRVADLLDHRGNDVVGMKAVL